MDILNSLCLKNLLLQVDFPSRGGLRGRKQFILHIEDGYTKFNGLEKHAIAG
jgi:hypothetical protein